MHFAPVSLFEKIPDLAQTLAKKQNLCLIFNLECIDNSHRLRATPNLNGIQRQIHWIADLPDIIPVILSNGPLNELKAIFDNHRIILAPNNGSEIYSSNFTWILPDLNIIRQELTDIFTAVRESLGNSFKPEHLNFSQSELWLKVSAGVETVRELVLEQFKTQKPSRLSLSVQNHQLTVAPRKKWDRGQAVLKIFDLVPHSNHQPPLIIYFGVEEDDEPAFHSVNKLGLSVIINNRIPLVTKACFFLRNLSELNKFLFWIQSR